MSNSFSKAGERPVSQSLEHRSSVLPELSSSESVMVGLRSSTGVRTVMCNTLKHSGTAVVCERGQLSSKCQFGTMPWGNTARATYSCKLDTTAQTGGGGGGGKGAWKAFPAAASYHQLNLRLGLIPTLKNYLALWSSTRGQRPNLAHQTIQSGLHLDSKINSEIFF